MIDRLHDIIQPVSLHWCSPTIHHHHHHQHCSCRSPTSFSFSNKNGPLFIKIHLRAICQNLFNASHRLLKDIAFLAHHVGNTSQCWSFSNQHICQSDTEEPTTYPIYLNNSQQVQISPNVQGTHFYVWAELHVCIWTPCREKLCRFGHPCRHIFAKLQTWLEHVADMSPTQHSLLAFGQPNWHADIGHNGLRLSWRHRFIYSSPSDRSVFLASIPSSSWFSLGEKMA